MQSMNEKPIPWVSFLTGATIGSFGILSCGYLCRYVFRCMTTRHGGDSVSGHSSYETHRLLDEYLRMHFDDSIVPGIPAMATMFPKECANICERYTSNRGRVLDVGCAVGRASFELARHFSQVIGIDFSYSFINAALRLKEHGKMPYRKVVEGDLFEEAMAVVDKSIDRSRVSFEQGDACDLRPGLGTFDVVLGANLLCRLPNPRAFLQRLPDLMNDKGIVVLPSPYTWMDSFTPRENWIGGRRQRNADGNVVCVRSAEELQELMDHLGFDLLDAFDVPFCIRETARKNQFTLSHCTVWQKRAAA